MLQGTELQVKWSEREEKALQDRGVPAFLGVMIDTEFKLDVDRLVSI